MVLFDAFVVLAFPELFGLTVEFVWLVLEALEALVTLILTV